MQSEGKEKKEKTGHIFGENVQKQKEKKKKKNMNQELIHVCGR